MKGCTFNTANLPVCLIDFNYTRDTNTAKFDSYFRHFGESVIFVFRQTKSKFAHGEWRSLSANPDIITAEVFYSMLTLVVNVSNLFGLQVFHIRPAARIPFAVCFDLRFTEPARCALVKTKNH